MGGGPVAVDSLGTHMDHPQGFFLVPARDAQQLAARRVGPIFEWRGRKCQYNVCENVPPTGQTKFHMAIITFSIETRSNI